MATACDSMSPGVCALGQQALGSFFSFFFGSISGLTLKSRRFGSICGSAVGVLAARNPDAVDRTALAVVLAAAIAGSAAAESLFPGAEMTGSFLCTAAPVACLYFMEQHQRLMATEGKGKSGPRDHLADSEGRASHRMEAAVGATSIER